jgi:predicted dehydrogenase
MRLQQKPPATGGTSNGEISRRSVLLAGALGLGISASSYSRITGANDRILLGHVGVGNRGRELASIVAGLKSIHNVEMAAVCDLWTVNRERATRDAGQAYGRPPRACACIEELLADKDVDAVIISTPDFQHAPMLKMVAEAGKDAYCEKPMGNVLKEAKAARDAVRSRHLVVQIGTQHRSERYQIAAKDWISRGVLGGVSKVEIVWNYHGPRRVGALPASFQGGVLGGADQTGGRGGSRRCGRGAGVDGPGR